MKLNNVENYYPDKNTFDTVKIIFLRLIIYLKKIVLKDTMM